GRLGLDRDRGRAEGCRRGRPPPDRGVAAGSHRGAGPMNAADRPLDEFFRFPHTPHLLWLGDGMPRADKVLPPDEAEALLAREVTVEEKVDGANVGVSVDQSGELRAQNRGAWVERDGCHPQFSPMFG